MDLKPLKIKKLQKKFKEERKITSENLKISKKLNKGIQENPIKSKFQID